MNRNGFLFFIVLVFCGLGIGYVLMQQKTAFVKVGVIMTEYERMINAETELKQRISILEDFIVSQERLLYNATNNLADIKLSSKLSHKEILFKQIALSKMEKAILLKKNQMPHKADSLRLTIVGPVINEINTYIERYGRENGLDYVFGNIGNGNIMYGRPERDITNEILNELNESYNQLTKRAR